MQWIVLSYSLPPKSSSSPRVSLWRRLRRLGAVSLAGGAYILPAREECVEGFQWLAQEIQYLNGQALLMHVEKLAGMTDQQLIELFRAARKEDYTELEAQLADLEKTVKCSLETEAHNRIKGALSRLQRQHADIARIDYFSCPEGTGVAARLARVTEAVAPEAATRPEIGPADIAAYRDKTWVTRPRPHVDRLACAWLIRRYINSDAVICYSFAPAPGEVTFDMNDAHFGHTGNLCTFETMLLAFNLQAPALSSMAEIVHEIDLRDELYARPESAGIDAVLKGWLLRDLPDAEIELNGIALFDGLYESLATRTTVFSDPVEEKEENL